MKGLSLALFVAVLATVAMSAPEGTRDHPAKFTAADAVRTPKRLLPHREDAGAPPEGGTEGEAAPGEPSAAHESKRLRRSLRTISEAIHGKPERKLVAIPISHGVKKATKAGSSVKAAAGIFGASEALSSLGHVPVVLAVVKGAKLAAPVVKPALVTAHFAGKMLAHKVHTVGKIVDHKVAKLSRHL